MISEKDFDDGTQKLIKLSAGFNVKTNGKDTFPDIVKNLRSAFKNDEIYRTVIGEERKPEFRYGKNFCLVASNYIMQNTGGDAVWTLATGPMHWWLVHKSTGSIFDVTYDQFPGRYNYSFGRPETRIPTAKIFTAKLKHQMALLSKYIGASKFDNAIVSSKSDMAYIISMAKQGMTV